MVQGMGIFAGLLGCKGNWTNRERGEGGGPERAFFFFSLSKDVICTASLNIRRTSCQNPCLGSDNITRHPRGEWICVMTLSFFFLPSFPLDALALLCTGGHRKHADNLSALPGLSPPPVSLFLCRSPGQVATPRSFGPLVVQGASPASHVRREMEMQ